MNVLDTKMYSLGHVDSAIESTALIDIPGVFISKNITKGLQAVLKDCNYNKGHNFNLLITTGKIVPSSTECRFKMNINMAHCLLCHCYEDSVRKMAREVGWVLTCGTLKPCKHFLNPRPNRKMCEE